MNAELENEGSLADVIETQLEAGTSAIDLGELGRVLANAIERGRIVVQRQLPDRDIENVKVSEKYL